MRLEDQGRRLRRLRGQPAGLGPAAGRPQVDPALLPAPLGASCPCVIDPDQFEKIVLNLLSNAVKFTPEGGRITVYLDETAEAVQFAVEDTGIGIPPDMLETIFDRFSQVDGSLSRAHEGTGIGLSLVRELVTAARRAGPGRERDRQGLPLPDRPPQGRRPLRRRHPRPPGLRHAGGLQEEGQRCRPAAGPGHRHRLPQAAAHGPGAGGAGAPKSPTRSRRHDNNLVVVDDNPEVLKLMKLLLEDEFDLHLASSGEEALTLIRDKMPDVVISDVMMPGMDGHALTRRIKTDESSEHIPVILVTARSGAEMLNEGIEAGADDYLPKPFDSVELKARIRNLLRMRRAEADLALANRNLKMRTSDLVERQRSLFLAMVRSLVSALEAKDKYTRDHSSRVTEFSLRIARSMSLDERELNDLEMAAILHDVGKIAMPERILHKKIAPDRRGVRRHPPAPGHRREHPQARRRAAADRPHRPLPPRALRRARLSRRAEGPGHPDRGPDHGRGRHLRRHHLQPAVPRLGVAQLRAEGNHQVLRPAVRPRGRRALHRSPQGRPRGRLPAIPRRRPLSSRPSRAEPGQPSSPNAVPMALAAAISG